MLGNEIKKNLYFKYGVSLLVALVISLFFSHTIFNDIFASPAKEARLVITATAERNIKSGGSDIRIVRILLDGEEVPFDSIEKGGLESCRWCLDGGQSGQPGYAFLYSRKCERASGGFPDA